MDAMTDLSYLKCDIERKNGMKRVLKTLACIASLVCCQLYAQTDGFGFDRYYSDGLVIQREKPVRIKGFAPEGAQIALTFGDQKKECVADKYGKWEVTLDPMPANGKGQQLVVHSPLVTRPLSLANVVVGDVFLFARQTSIDVSLGRDDEGKAAAAKAGDAGFRVIRIRTVPAAEPLNDLPAESTSGWSAVNEQEALKMSAAAFYLARDLAKSSEVPIGIVDLNMGHYFPVAWMSREDLLETGNVMPHGTGKDLYQGENAPKSQVEIQTLALHKYESGEEQKAIDEYQAGALEKAKKEGKPAPDAPVAPLNPLEDSRFPAAGYNSVINPLQGAAFKGVLLQLGNDYFYVLYQKIIREGEGLSRGHLGWAWKNNYDLRKWGIYLEPWTIPRMVPQWRVYFADKDLPLGLIMPPASDLGTLADHHCEMRELQRKAAEENKGVGLILPDYEHVPFSAQPADEKVVAERCLAWVKGGVYGQKNVAPSGPLFDRIESSYSTAKVFFKPGTADGLRAGPGALDCFEVAGADAEYVPAKASIEDGSTIRLTSDKVNRIVHVRYNWLRKPDSGLTNRDGLPAIPFRTDDHKYPSVFSHAEKDLPEEYSTPAKDWKDGDIAIVNGSLAPGNWHNGEGWLGACGVLTAPFGPNMGVLHVLKGSPADGKILVGDIIYDVNGKLLGDDPLRVAADAITYAESEAGNGGITFGLRRKGKNLNVSLKLEVLGTYSSTSPYDCPKTDRIVSNMEEFLAARGGVMPKRHCVYQNMEALFLQGAGTPEYLGLVRRHVYSRMSTADLSKRLDPMTGPFPQNWIPAYDALLVSEYYLATGDPNVLPFLKWCCDYLAMTQNKVEAMANTPWPTALAGQAGGWRHNFYGGQGYGMLTALGVPALIGFRFAKEAGVDVDEAAYQRGLQYFIHNGVRVGSVFYGWRTEPVTVPQPIDMEALNAGKLHSSNGMKGLVALLFKLEGDLNTAHLNSFITANSYNNLHEAHGGNFWGNCFAGVGAYVHSEKAFMKFMQGNAWYRDLHRMYNHSYHQGSGDIGGGQYLSYVLPRHRLRMLGAPESVFSGYPKDFFRPALEAHRNRDYAACAKLAEELLSTQVLDTTDRAKAEQLKRVAMELEQSIELDLAKVEKLIAEGKLYEAGLDLPQLKGVLAQGNARLAAINDKLTDPSVKDAISKDKARYNAAMDSLDFDVSIPKPSDEDEAGWVCLTPQSSLYGRSFKGGDGSVGDELATKWRIKIVESMDQAPEGWTERGFDASSWGETALPIAWAINHTALLRADFNVEDKKAIEALRIRLFTYRQQNIQVYINGQLAAKVNEASNNTTTTALLTDAALRLLKNGSNTIAVTTLNNWRWGSYMTKFETDENNSVRNNGFTMLLDARKK